MALFGNDSDELQRAARYTELVQRAKLSPRLAPIVQSGNHSCVLGKQRPDLLRCLAQKIDPEPGDTKLAHPPDVLRAALGHAVVDRVPASGIDVNREQRAGAVLQLDRVLVARSAAI